MPKPAVIQNFDAIILGGGAAGLMCALTAGQRGRRVVVLERSDRIGKKILISGGGRCNFTNLHCQPENFISANPHFCKSALARYTPADFITLVEKHGIAYHEKKLGQLFCDGSARQIVDMLNQECRASGVSLQVDVTVEEVLRDTTFSVRAGGSEYRAPALVVATGGLSIPKLGATGFGYDIARQFGLRVRDCRPALVPLTFVAEDLRRYTDLSGVSTETIVSTDGASFREKLLFTHFGLSGPAILQASSYWKPGAAITIDLAPDRNVMASLLAAGSRRDIATARNALRATLPIRLADRWLELHAPRNLTNRSVDELEHRLHRWEIHPSGTAGYGKAEVTAGGIDTSELLAKTMESRKVPGLFFIGEAVDVTGQLGGFNFQWAWASGYCTGQAL